MCTNPYKGFVVGTKPNGKKDIILTSYNVHHVEKLPNGQFMKVYDDHIVHQAFNEFIDIPCGSCLECRLEYSRMWSNRCMVEAQQYDQNAFVTLTYDDLCIPTSEFEDKNGNFIVNNTLDKRDLQLFIKKLRNHLNYCGVGRKKYYNKDDPEFHLVRYFGSGEYGETTKRPHYHLIIFNWYPEDYDLKLVKVNNLGQKIYTSELLSKLWPYGFNTVGKCTEASCSYVARYVTKKLNDFDQNIYDELHVQPEFVIMSRKPGIGRAWFEQNNKCYAIFMKNYLATEDGQVVIRSNRYYDSLLEELDPEAFEKIKKIRKHFSRQGKFISLDQTTLPYLETLKNKDRNIKDRTRILSRKGA